jgi:hypothetical protein
MVPTSAISTFSRTSAGMSTRSFPLRLGRITFWMPARAAPSTFALMPPTGSTRPRSEISPVAATEPRARRPESAETSAVTSATPAEGPSLGTAPAGTCRWISASRRRSGGRPRRSALARTQLSAASADSRITSPSWPVSRSRSPSPPRSTLASMKRMSPPWLVWARPTATPDWVVRSAVSGRWGGGPSASPTKAASTTTRVPGALLATRRAHLRITLAM